ncbi:hypothetical protein ACFO3I_16320 [Rheinheimera marina]|uniref:Uncharacterized protein n=1 Tax=Rheinheimera marina TaxID=1774958 RepID=A0ABV9JQQ1_9GAMM
MDESTINFTQKIEENIEYQFNKIYFLFGERNKTTKQLMKEVLEKKEPDSGNVTVNQALTDALINAMASLIDYYHIYCFIRIGLGIERITEVQYKPINNYALRSSSSLKNKNKDLPTLDFIREQFNKKIAEICNMDIAGINKIPLHDYWHAYFGEAISEILSKVGLTDKKFNFKFESNKFIIDKKIQKFHYYMNMFYCNEFSQNGAKYDIYIDINNCLKHNIVPYVKMKIISFENEERGYLHFEIKNEDVFFLRRGLLKSIVELSFDETSQILNLINEGESNTHSNADLKWIINNLFTIDKENGYINKDKDRLHFFVGNVLIEKSKDATYVDAAGSLKITLQNLIDDIKRGIGLDMSEFDREEEKNKNEHGSNT